MKAKILTVCVFFVSSFCQADEPAVEPDFTTEPAIVEMHTVAMRRRERSGLRLQVLDRDCCTIAQRWANHMAATGSMYHGGGEQIIASGYATAEAAIAAWEASSGHRAWLFGGSDRCGWGCQRSAAGTWFWAGAFRSRESVVVQVTTSDGTTGKVYYRHRLRRR